MYGLQAVVIYYSSALVQLFFTIRANNILPIKPNLADFPHRNAAVRKLLVQSKRWQRQSPEGSKPKKFSLVLAIVVIFMTIIKYRIPS